MSKKDDVPWHKATTLEQAIERLLLKGLHANDPKFQDLIKGFGKDRIVALAKAIKKDLQQKGKL